MIELIVNGTRRRVTTTDVRGLVAEIGLDADGRGVAVAVDGRVVPRSEWSVTALHEGAMIEVVGATQGG